ncbi:hypothetical protein ABIC11_004443, partial [Pseudomonas oryzihabitans]
MGIFERLRGKKTADTSTAEQDPVPSQPELIEPGEEADLAARAEPALHPESIRATRALEVDEEAAYQRYLDRLRAHGIP